MPLRELNKKQDKERARLSPYPVKAFQKIFEIFCSSFASFRVPVRHPGVKHLSTIKESDMEPLYIYASLLPSNHTQQQEKARIQKTDTTKGGASTCNSKRKSTGKQACSSTASTFLLLFLLLAGFAAKAQTSQQKSVHYKALSPPSDHYQTIGAVDDKSTGSKLESVTFPARDFRRGSYLKMRTVYLDVPVEAFRIKPYPANSSAQTRAELDLLLKLQQNRTAADMALTDTMAGIYYDPFTANPLDPDYTRNITSLFYLGRNLGPWFNPEQLPVTSRVLQNVIQDATYYFFSLKARYNRARPYHLEPALKNLEAPGHASYPSGHSSASHVHAYLLSAILPQNKDQFLGNAYDMAFSREIRGVHYPSDSEAGKEFARQFVAELLKSKKFNADFAAMKAEITRVKNQHILSLQK